MWRYEVGALEMFLAYHKAKVLDNGGIRSYREFLLEVLVCHEAVVEGSSQSYMNTSEHNVFLASSSNTLFPSFTTSSPPYVPQFADPTPSASFFPTSSDFPSSQNTTPQMPATNLINRQSYMAPLECAPVLPNVNGSEPGGAATTLLTLPVMTGSSDAEDDAVIEVKPERSVVVTTAVRNVVDVDNDETELITPVVTFPVAPSSPSTSELRKQMILRPEPEPESQAEPEAEPQAEPEAEPEAEAELVPEPDSNFHSDSCHDSESNATANGVSVSDAISASDGAPNSRADANSKRKLSVPSPRCRIQCRMCGRRFPNRSSLLQHRRSHFGNRPVRCSKCPQTFWHVSHLKTHEAAMHPKPSEPPHQDGLFRCTLCDSTFPRSLSLSNHIRRHSQRPPNPCGLCPLTFLSKTARDRHAQVHAVDSTNTVTPSSQTFVHPPLANTKEKTLNCELCLQRFVSPRVFKQHMKHHRTEM